jgi:hypothetical protein
MYGNDLDVVLQVISKFIGIFRISCEILHQSGEQLPRFYAGTEVVHQRACGDEDEVCCAVLCCWVARQLPSQGLRFRLVRRATLQHRSVLRRATARRHVAHRRLVFYSDTSLPPASSTSGSGSLPPSAFLADRLWLRRRLRGLVDPPPLCTF